jgi:hypothetical protein
MDCPFKILLIISVVILEEGRINKIILAVFSLSFTFVNIFLCSKLSNLNKLFFNCEDLKYFMNSS